MTHARLARIAGGSLAAGLPLIALGGWLFAIPVILFGGLLVGIAIILGAYILFTPAPPPPPAPLVKPAAVSLRETAHAFAAVGETELAEMHARMADELDRHPGNDPVEQRPAHRPDITTMGCPDCGQPVIVRREDLYRGGQLVHSYWNAQAALDEHRQVCPPRIGGGMPGPAADLR